MFNLLQNFTFRQAGIGSRLFHHYVENNVPNANWINAYPNQVDFNRLGLERLSSFPQHRRDFLVQALLNQYKSANILDETVEENIQKLAKPNTLCVTTGHQLGFAGGPLFLLSKIASVVSLARNINENHSDIQVVPVFWMNSDDHDLAEVNSFFWANTHWTIPIADNRGPVGDYSCPEMPEFWEQLKLMMPAGTAWSQAYLELKTAYQPGITLGMAFRRLIANWTQGAGLILLDQQDSNLKGSAWNYMANLLEQEHWFNNFAATTQEQQSAGFAPQVKPMPNLFFFHSSSGRERIEMVGQKFVSHQTKTGWSFLELKSEMQKQPQLFSTNVTGRSLYQEFILPNIAYLGGAAEIRYWMQFSGIFQGLNLPFPVLVPRETFLFLTPHELKILDKSKISLSDFFGKNNKPIQKWIRSTFDAFENEPWNEQLNEEGLKWAQAFALSDPSLFKAVLARYRHLNNEMKALNAKRLRTIKKREHETLLKLNQLQDWIQPQGILQERIQHPWLLGPEVKKSFQELLAHSNPIQNQVVVLSF